MIGQDGEEFHTRLRTSATGSKGRPRRLRTFDFAVTDELTHLVYVFDGASGEAAFWIDGEERMLEVGGNFVNGDVGGNLSDPGNGHDGWDETYTFGIANEDGQLDRAARTALAGVPALLEGHVPQLPDRREARLEG